MLSYSVSYHFVVDAGKQNKLDVHHQIIPRDHQGGWQTSSEKDQSRLSSVPWPYKSLYWLASWSGIRLHWGEAPYWVKCEGLAKAVIHHPWPNLLAFGSCLSCGREAWVEGKFPRMLPSECLAPPHNGWSCLKGLGTFHLDPLEHLNVCGDSAVWWLISETSTNSRGSDIERQLAVPEVTALMPTSATSSTKGMDTLWGSEGYLSAGTEYLPLPLELEGAF